MQSNSFMQSKSMDWFLYDNGLRHERVKYDEKCFLLHVKSSFRSQDIYFFVLSIWSYRKTAWLERQGDQHLKK